MPEDDVCGICRVQFDGTCPTCKYPGDDCTLCELIQNPQYSVFLELCTESFTVIGKCGHSFHMVRTNAGAMMAGILPRLISAQHCLLTWIQQDSSKGLCPMCRQSKKSNYLSNCAC